MQPFNHQPTKIKRPPNLDSVIRLINERREIYFPKTPLPVRRPDVLDRFGPRYTQVVREHITLMRLAAKLDPEVTHGTMNRTAKYRGSWTKSSIDQFIKKHLGPPFDILFTNSKIYYSSLDPMKPWVLIEDPVNRYFRIVHKDEDRASVESLPPNKGRYRDINLNYVKLNNREKYQRLTHFNYAPFSKNEEALFQRLGLFEFGEFLEK
jgi:hypothetical protein